MLPDVLGIKDQFIKVFILQIFSLIGLNVFAQNSMTLSFEEVVNNLSLKSPSAKIVSIDLKNSKLEFDNYKKSFLPSISLSLTPFNFNRSINLLQNPSDGSYRYVEDYLGNTNGELSLSQNIGVTGGQLTINTSQNFVNEFSSSRRTFNSLPFSISYSQSLFGGYRTYRYEKEQAYKKNTESELDYCIEILKIQQQASNLYISVYASLLEKNIKLSNLKQSDSLQRVAEVRFETGSITKHDYDLIKIKKTEREYQLEEAKAKYKKHMKSLLDYLGLPTHNNLQKYKLFKPDFNLPFGLNKETVLSIVNQNNPFRLKQELKKLEIEAEFFNKKLNNSVNPNISISYGSNQFSDNFLDSYRNPNSRQSVSLSLSIPIFKWGVDKNTLKIADNNYKKKLTILKNEEIEFYNDLEEKTLVYNSTINQFFLSEQKYKIYKKHYELMQQTFLLEKASIYDLYSAKNEEQNAMQKYIDALNNVWDAYFTLRTLTLYDFVKNEELIPKIIVKTKPNL